VGTFTGNFDGNTEVINNLLDPSMSKRGVVARHIRVIPLNRDAHGFLNEKALRVRFFGYDVDELGRPIIPTEKRKTQLNISTQAAENEDKKEQCDAGKNDDDDDDEKERLKLAQQIMASSCGGLAQKSPSGLGMSLICISRNRPKQRRDGTLHEGTIRSPQKDDKKPQEIKKFKQHVMREMRQAIEDTWSQ
jgi:hypothetical protein